MVPSMRHVPSYKPYRMRIEPSYGKTAGIVLAAAGCDGS